MAELQKEVEVTKASNTKEPACEASGIPAALAAAAKGLAPPNELAAPPHGNANGHANGNANGHANGHAMWAPPGGKVSLPRANPSGANGFFGAKLFQIAVRVPLSSASGLPTMSAPLTYASYA
eukprot:42774-Pyramimonas_sp.AAC.1